jgi:RecB family endonuclease NucS
MSLVVGPIDLLAKDAEGIYVVIELKRGRTSDRVIGQIARYLTWVSQRLGRGKESSVRGIIVGQDFDKHFDAAFEQLKRVSAYMFDLKIFFEHRLAAKERPSK